MRLRIFALAAFAASVLATSVSAAPLPGGTLDPLTVTKYVDPLTIPPTMPNAVDPLTGLRIPDRYDIAVRQFQQQVLPTGFPLTTVWGYGSVADPATFNYPAFTIESRQHTPVTVTWRNELVKPDGTFLPPLLPVDQTLHWANPTQVCNDGSMMTDCRGVDPNRYMGPVPIVTHLHGGHVEPAADGYPEAWYLPAATDIPVGYATQGSNYATMETAPAGAATFVYRNDQRGSTLWYHDHSLGMTRTNVYSGLAGFYLHRDAYELGLRLPSGQYEVPLAIQDRSFNADGSLFYADSRTFFDGFGGPYLPTPGSDVSPIWNPEFFGNMMVVNGKTWPKLAVEPRKYRFRLLNGCDSRFLILQLADSRLRPLNLPFAVIGNDGGFLPVTSVQPQVLIGPGERYDVVVDFTAVPAGTRVILANVAPDSPFGGGNVPAGAAADPATTGQVMAFDVVPLTAPDTSVLPTRFTQPADPFGAPNPAAKSATRFVTLTEFGSVVAPGPSEAQLGDGYGPLPWMAPITETPLVGDTEVWGIVNTTADAHPIHLHQVQFNVVSRVALDMRGYLAAAALCQRPAPGAAPTPGCPVNPKNFVAKSAAAIGPAAQEKGQKDTVAVYPGEYTLVRARFDIPGLYVWHCHILSHEDNEMMRPICAVNSLDPQSPLCIP